MVQLSRSKIGNPAFGFGAYFFPAIGTSVVHFWKVLNKRIFVYIMKKKFFQTKENVLPVFFGVI